MKLCFSPAGMRVTVLWLALAVGGLGVVFFLLYRLLGLLFWGAGGLFCLYCRFFYLPSVCIQIEKTELAIEAGVVFPSKKRIPLRALCGLFQYSTPLLRAAGCRALMLYASSGQLCFLPALSRSDADILAGLLREG